jgi:hypothetical protein
MNDFDRTLELVNISQESAGATNAQQVKFMEGLQFALVNLQTAYQNFIKTLSDTQIIIDSVNFLAEALNSLASGLETLGMAGKNFMIVIGTLFAISKLIPIITKLVGSIKILITGLKAATTAAAAFKAVIVAGSGPIGLAILAIMGVVTAVGFLATKTERAEKALKKQNDIIEAAQYEFNKLTRTVNDSIEEIDRLNNLSFLTPEQEKELENAKEKIAELVGEENIVRNIRGEVDIEASKKAIEDFIKSQKDALANSITEGYKLAQKRIKGTRSRGMSGTETFFIPTNDREVVDSIYKFFTLQYEAAGEKISPEVSDLYRNIIENILLNDPELLSTPEAINTFIEEQAKGTIQFLETSISKIEEFPEDISKQYKAFNEQLKIGTTEQSNLLKIQYKELAGLEKEFGSELGQQVASGLQKSGITTTANLQKAIEVYGQNLPSVLENINNKINKILKDNVGISNTTALSMA